MKLLNKFNTVSAMALMALYSCSTVKPIAPVKSGSDIPVIEQPVSNIEIPVTADLKNYFVQAENSVPNQYSDNQQNCEGLSYKYFFKRTPFSITGSNNTINLKFIGTYGITASYCAKCSDIFGSGMKCLVPTVTASCGMDGEAGRRMEISYRSTISVQPDYHLKSKTILYPLPNPLDRCNVFMKIDVTDRLISFITDPLMKLGSQVDEKIAAFDVKPMVNQLWNSLSTEYKLPDVGFLYINPQSVRLSNFNLNGSQLNFSVGLSAKPVVSTSNISQAPKPLPNLSTYVPASGFNIYVDMFEDYDKLSDFVNQQVAGQVIPVAGKEFIVTNVKVYGTGKQIAMAIDFKGSNTGTIYLLGTPVYNQATHDLTFPDLSFDLQTKSWMIHFAKWMFNGRITETIREKAKYNFTQFMADSKAKLQTQLHQDMMANVHSDVNIKDLNIQAIYPGSDKLVVRTFSNGQIKVKITM